MSNPKLVGAVVGAAAFGLASRTVIKSFSVSVGGSGLNVTKPGNLLIYATVLLVGATVGFTTVQMYDEFKASKQKPAFQ